MVGLPVAIRGPVGAKTQPTGIVLVELVVVDELEEVVLLEVVDVTLEELVVVDEVEDVVRLVEVVECVVVVTGT